MGRSAVSAGGVPVASLLAGEWVPVLVEGEGPPLPLVGWNLNMELGGAEGGIVLGRGQEVGRGTGVGAFWGPLAL